MGSAFVNLLNLFNPAAAVAEAEERFIAAKRLRRESPSPGGEFPIAITFDRRKDGEALYLGRTSPLVSRVCDALLGEAFSLEGDERFARAGAMFTDAVATWTALMLLRPIDPKLFRHPVHAGARGEPAGDLLPHSRWGQAWPSNPRTSGLHPCHLSYYIGAWPKALAMDSPPVQRWVFFRVRIS
jgi:hypothetical protein